MAKRIATQLAEEIEAAIAEAEGWKIVSVTATAAHRWLKWAKSLDARMRLDGSPRSKKRKPAKG